MQTFRLRTAIVLLMGISLIGGGCTTTRTMPLPRTTSGKQQDSVKPGDRVIVTLQNGDVRTFRIDEVESDALVGRNIRIAFADIANLERKKVSIGRTAGLVGGVIVAVAGMFVVWVIEAGKHDD